MHLSRARHRKDSLAAERAIDPTLDDYIKSLDQFPRLSDDEILALSRRALASRDIETVRAYRNQIVEANLRLVVAACREFIGRGMSALDVIQEGNLGLVIAAERFDPERGLSFSNYAMWWIAKAFRRALQEKIHPIRISNALYQQRGRVLRATDQFISETGRDPSDDELLEVARISAEQLERVRNAPSGTVSLDVELSGSDEESITLADLVPSDEPDILERIVDDEAIETLHRYLRGLTSEQREVLAYRFGLPPAFREHSQEEIAQILGMTRRTVRNHEREALCALRTQYLHAAEDSGDEVTASKLRALIA